MKLTRRRLVLGAVSGLGIYGASVAWNKRYFLRIVHKVVGAPRGPLSQTPMLASAVGSLDDTEKAALWRFFGLLGRTWDMDVGDRASFFSLLDLKTQQAPSYLGEYRNAAARFTALERGQSPEAAVAAMLRPSDGDTLGAHARDFVAREYIVLLLMSGGFRRFGLGKYPGFPGGQGGYRLSKRERAAVPG
jgi:hypothetical protein